MEQKLLTPRLITKKKKEHVMSYDWQRMKTTQIQNKKPHNLPKDAYMYTLNSSCMTRMFYSLQSPFIFNTGHIQRS